MNPMIRNVDLDPDWQPGDPFDPFGKNSECVLDEEERQFARPEEEQYAARGVNAHEQN